MTNRLFCLLLRGLAIPALFIFLLATTSCFFSAKPIYYKDDKATALKRVEQFHQFYNDEKYDEAYDMFTPRLKEEISREKFTTAMRKLRDESGKVSGFKEIRSEVIPQASVREVRFVFETEFEKNKNQEGFAFLVDGNDANIDAYFL